MDLEQKEERPQSEASSGSRGVPTTPPPTYLWEELRRSRSKGGYPWTYLDKEPLPDNVDVELLLKGEIPENWFDTEYLRSRSANADKRTFKNRLRDRERSRRARSEPTPSVLSSSNASLSVGMDQAMAADPSNYESTDIDDFLLGDEDIPDFVMAYLQSDKGNLDEDIPSNILEYIQSRAAILEKHQQLQHQQSDEIFYTENELRIIDEARKRLEERGELNLSPSDFKDVVEIDNFDHYFQIPVSVSQASSSNPEVITVEPENIKQQDDSKKGQRFKLKKLTMPTKAQLNIKLPKMGRSKKPKKESEEQHDTELVGKKKRPHSLSPMRQKINQQIAIWNDSLKKFKVPGRRLQDPSQNATKSFVALLPGARSSSKHKIENQYEEIGAGRVELSNIPLVITVTEPDNISTKKAECSAANENEGTEETMEGIENLPESEVVETPLEGVKSETREETIPEDFVDIDIHGEFKEHGVTEINAQKVDLPKSTLPESKGLAARSKKAFQTTKSKIQTSLSKEQLEATRKKLHATRKKVESTLSKQNFQATRNKFQTTLNSTLKKKKGANPPNPLLLNPSENIFPEHLQGETRDFETSTPIKMKDERKNLDANFSNEEFLYEPHSSAPTAHKRWNKKKFSMIKNGDCAEESKIRPHIKDIEEEIEEYLEEEIEPKLEFFLHGTEPVRPPSVSRSTETLPEESDKENVVIRPKRQRYHNRRQGFYEQIEEPLNDHNTLESNENWKYSQKPEKPIRTRSKKSLTSITSGHIYSNVPPMRRKRGQPKNLSQQWSTSTWPRQNVIAESFHQPVAPKRLKSKLTKISINYNMGNDNQTWPRRSIIKSPPSAPQRKRDIGNKKNINCSIETMETKDSCMELDQNKLITNILVDADVLFGAESRFIDEDSTDKKNKAHPTKLTGTLEDAEHQKVKPPNNILAEADTLFGAESRFIDEEVLNLIDDGQIRSSNFLSENFSNNSSLMNSGESNFSNETKVTNQIDPLRIPSAPTRQRKCSGSLRKQKCLKNLGKDDATWPRMSKHQPSAPRRRQKSDSKDKNFSNITINEPCTQLERSSKELPLTPIVPSSTPSDPIPISAGADFIQAGLDHILEILATLPRETSNNFGITSHDENVDGSIPHATKPSEEEDISSENPYAEIKQFQKKKPPRPPPPIYDPASSSSYSFIYTVPRRKKRINQTVLPERPPRNYCTIRPHRPPRKHRSFRSPTSIQAPVDKQQQEENIRRHSFSGASNVQDENIHQTQKNLLDSEAAPCWMLSRPLPAPPRVKKSPQKPPRSRASSLQRPKKSIKIEETEQIKEDCSQVLAPQTENVLIPNEYEPIEDPVKVEETSVGIQTDPPLDDDESSIINLDAINEEELKYVDGHLQIDSINEPLQEAYEGGSLKPNTANAEEHARAPETGLDIAVNIGCDPIHPPSNSGNQPTTEEHTLKLKEEDKIEQKQETKCKKCEEAENSDCMSNIPLNFQRPIPQPHRPIRFDFPTRLQLLELDVERLTVREVIADRLTVSQVETNTLDTNTLEVSQMTSASGQLIFNVGSNAVAIPSTVMSLSESEAKESEVIENVRTGTPTDMSRDEGRNTETQIVTAVPQQSKVESKKETFESSSQTTFENPQNQERVERATSIITAVPTPSVTDLTSQLVGLTSQNLARFGCAAATETWEVAKRVARLGLEQVNKQLQRQGVHFDDTEKDNAKAILMVLLILVAAIFLLGMGRVPHRLSNHWEFYFTN